MSSTLAEMANLQERIRRDFSLMKKKTALSVLTETTVKRSPLTAAITRERNTQDYTVLKGV